MIGYARLKPGPGFQPVNALLYYGQRVVTPPRLRGAVSGGIASAIRFWRGAGRGMAAEADLKATATATILEQEGLAALPALADPEAIGRIAAYFNAAKVVGAHGALLPVDRLPSGMASAAYPMETVLGCREVLEMVNAPEILRIAERYLGCTPTLSSLGVRWSFPAAATRTETQRFHRDLDDWRFLKLFIYLTDVDEESGPHVYVLGSHKTAARMRAEVYERAALEERYGRQSLVTVTGARGTAFLAATHGIHMGAPPISRPRLILQAQYSLLPVFAFNYRPVSLPVAQAIDPYVNRLLVHPKPSTEPAAPPDLARKRQMAIPRNA